MDWVGIPLMPYLYAVERAADVPTFATSDVVLTLRDDYRRARLRDIFPDPPPSEPLSVRWTQLVGAAYDRQIIAFSVKTTPEQDDALIAENERRGESSTIQRVRSKLRRLCARSAESVPSQCYT
jgi:hypothetical protein